MVRHSRGGVLEVEERAFAAWPAEEVRALAGWQLRYTPLPSRRTRSVWPGRAEGGLSLERRLEEVESFYRTHNARPLYQLSPIAQPIGLDLVLSEHGYAVEAPTSVLTGAPQAACHQPRPGIGVTVETELFDTWFEISAHRGRFASVSEGYRRLLGRLSGRSAYALAEINGEPAAVGLGVVDGNWMGIFSMLTVPEHRRRGLAAAVLGGLAGFARVRGIEHLYLQVEHDNAAALALYRASGLAELYRYHYRYLPR